MTDIIIKDIEPSYQQLVDENKSLKHRIGRVKDQR